MRIFDGHNDALSRIARSGPGALGGFLAGDGAGHLDLPRAAAGGLAGGCFAVFTCSPPDDAYDDGAYFAEVAHGAAWREAMIQVGILRGWSARPAAACGSPAPRPTSTAPGLVAVLHLEGAEPIGPGLEELELLHAAGMRSLGLTWSRPNAFATGVPFAFPGSPTRARA